MKKYLLLFLILLMPVCFSQEVKITGFINDYANILSSQDKAEIEPILKEIYDSGKAEYAVVTIDSLDGRDIEGYSYELAEGNLGDTEKNNGLLLLVAVQDRQYRFEVGRGLEPELPDIIAGRIGRDYLVPNFREGDYAKGIKEASMAVKDVLLGNTESEYYVDKEEEIPDEAIIFFIGSTLINIMILVGIFIFIFNLRSKKTGKRDHGEYFTAAWILSQMMKGGRGGFSGGGFSGGGFGGGHFGGGGASGRF
ncbi:TPM domain-containing protein [Candidatus Woesearchaeota archaeon]|nr:TPM domain-containing protein [Candidatus Woesearchaeota archaeon]